MSFVTIIFSAADAANRRQAQALSSLPLRKLFRSLRRILLGLSGLLLSAVFFFVFFVGARRLSTSFCGAAVYFVRFMFIYLVFPFAV